MTVETWLAFVAASVVPLAIPRPTVTLVVGYPVGAGGARRAGDHVRLVGAAESGTLRRPRRPGEAANPTRARAQGRQSGRRRHLDRRRCRDGGVAALASIRRSRRRRGQRSDGATD